MGANEGKKGEATELTEPDPILIKLLDENKDSLLETVKYSFKDDSKQILTIVGFGILITEIEHLYEYELLNIAQLMKQKYPKKTAYTFNEVITTLKTTTELETKSIHKAESQHLEESKLEDQGEIDEIMESTVMDEEKRPPTEQFTESVILATEQVDCYLYYEIVDKIECNQLRSVSYKILQLKWEKNHIQIEELIATRLAEGLNNNISDLIKMISILFQTYGLFLTEEEDLQTYNKAFLLESLGIRIMDNSKSRIGADQDIQYFVPEESNIKQSIEDYLNSNSNIILIDAQNEFGIYDLVKGRIERENRVENRGDHIERVESPTQENSHYRNTIKLYKDLIEKEESQGKDVTNIVGLLEKLKKEEADKSMRSISPDVNNEVKGENEMENTRENIYTNIYTNTRESPQRPPTKTKKLKQQRTVVAKSMNEITLRKSEGQNIEEIRRLGIIDIFSFYAKQNVTKHDTFDSRSDEGNFWGSGQFNKFSKEFKFGLTQQGAKELFNKHSISKASKRILSKEGFEEILEKLAIQRTKEEISILKGREDIFKIEKQQLNRDLDLVNDAIKNEDENGGESHNLTNAQNNSKMLNSKLTDITLQINKLTAEINLLKLRKADWCLNNLYDQMGINENQDYTKYIEGYQKTVILKKVSNTKKVGGSIIKSRYQELGQKQIDNIKAAVLARNLEKEKSELIKKEEELRRIRRKKELINNRIQRVGLDSYQSYKQRPIIAQSYEKSQPKSSINFISGYKKPKLTWETLGELTYRQISLKDEDVFLRSIGLDQANEDDENYLEIFHNGSARNYDEHYKDMEGGPGYPNHNSLDVQRDSYERYGYQARSSKLLKKQPLIFIPKYNHDIQIFGNPHISPVKNREPQNVARNVVDGKRYQAHPMKVAEGRNRSMQPPQKHKLHNISPPRGRVMKQGRRHPSTNRGANKYEYNIPTHENKNFDIYSPKYNKDLYNRANFIEREAKLREERQLMGIINLQQRKIDKGLHVAGKY